MTTFAEHDRIVVMDVEATCDDRCAVPKREMEIIEIGAVLVEAGRFALVDEFQSFVQPVRHPFLTIFCQKLTSIRQSDIENAPRLPDAVARFKSWMFDHGATVFASWGDYDRKQMEMDCSFHRVAYPMPGRHVNLKPLFSATRKIPKKLGMAEALLNIGQPLMGVHHRGIDDARNIAVLLPYAVGAR